MKKILCGHVYNVYIRKTNTVKERDFMVVFLLGLFLGFLTADISLAFVFGNFLVAQLSLLELASLFGGLLLSDNPMPIMVT